MRRSRIIRHAPRSVSWGETVTGLRCIHFSTRTGRLLRRLHPRCGQIRAYHSAATPATQSSPPAIIKADAQTIDLAVIQVGIRVHVVWSRCEHGHPQESSCSRRRGKTSPPSLGELSTGGAAILQRLALSGPSFAGGSRLCFLLAGHCPEQIDGGDDSNQY